MDVSSFWYTKNKDSKGITKLEILCIKSYLDNGYTFNLYTYDKDNEIFLPARSLIMRYLNLLILSLKLTCKINHFCIFIMKCGEEMVWIKI